VNAALATVLIVGGTTALRVLYDPKIADKPGALFKVAVGAFALGALLTVISGSAPGLASVLGVTLVFATLMLNGQAVITASGHVFGK
jgi:hypothetical protein